MALLSQLSSLVQSRGGIKAKQWGKVTALLAKDTTKVCGWRWAVGKQEVKQLGQKGGGAHYVHHEAQPTKLRCRQGTPLWGLLCSRHPQHVPSRGGAHYLA